MWSQALIVAASLMMVTFPAAAQPARKIDPATVEAYVKSAFGKAKDGWEIRVQQDETQRLCTQYRNEPPTGEAEKIVARELAAVAFPADGKLLGDWKAGQKIAQSGRGGQFSDPPGTETGGNCYACHQMSPAELSFGTLGPPLTNYGRDRKFDLDEAKAAYIRIFNSNAVLACSNMPRFGHHKVLTEQQIKDVLAYLFDPASPVNQ
jgi:L-cysteine S-thiosulfotransferase